MTMIVMPSVDVTNTTPPTDSNGDGIPDTIKTALGVDPMAPASVTSAALLGSSPSGTQSLPLQKLQIKVNFIKPGSDQVAISGLLPLATTFKPSGQKMAVDVCNGITAAFTLNSSGSGKSGNATFKLSSKKVKGSTSTTLLSPFVIKFSKGSFGTFLNAAGLTIKPAYGQRLVYVTLLINQTLYQKGVQVLYSNPTGTTAIARELTSYMVNP